VSLQTRPSLGRPNWPLGLAHFLGLLIGVQNPASMGIPGQEGRVQKPGKEFGPKTAFLDSLVLAVLCALVFLLIIGCAGLSPEGARVRLTNNPDVVKDCTFIANVRGTSGWGGAAGGSIGDRQVETKMKNQTAKIGGNTLFLIYSKTGFTPRGVGEAYRCPEPR
jgi:hypothetical protein